MGNKVQQSFHQNEEKKITSQACLCKDMAHNIKIYNWQLLLCLYQTKSTKNNPL